MVRRKITMIKYSIVPILIIAFVSILIVSGDTHAAGQSSTNYKIEADVISGGGNEASSSNYTNESTLGQPASGEPSSSTNYENQPGFWNVVIQPGGSSVQYNVYDTNQDCEIGDFELLNAIDQWAQGNLGDFPLLNLIDYWATGSYC